MDEPIVDPSHPLIVKRLQPDERVHTVVQTSSASLFITDRRVAVAAAERIALDVPFEGLRRIQFDIERQRPATLVLVPEHRSDEPQVLAVPRSHYAQVAAALATIGERLYDIGHSEGSTDSA